MERHVEGGEMMNFDFLRLKTKIAVVKLFIKVLSLIMDTLKAVTSKLDYWIDLLYTHVDISSGLTTDEASLFYRLRNAYDYSDKDSLDIISSYRKTGELPEDVRRKIAEYTVKYSHFSNKRETFC